MKSSVFQAHSVETVVTPCAKEVLSMAYTAAGVGLFTGGLLGGLIGGVIGIGVGGATCLAR